MHETAGATRHDVLPEQALGAIRAHAGLLVVDLDETLYLRNSTEDFIDCARPQLLAVVLLRGLETVRPWRWTGGVATRDVWRVNLIRACFPRTGHYWRQRVPVLAAQFGNQRLLAALPPSHEHLVIATIGFQAIVAPLVLALGLSRARLIAARVSGFADRRAGKLALASAVLGPAAIRDALVLTDSAQDLALLEACRRPLRAVWPEARFREGLSGVYLPGLYLTRIKRPGERYVIRAILQEDFAFWVLATVGLAAVPVAHVLGLLFLLGSFWAIYERGYVDNDQIAARFEARPKLSAAFAGSDVVTPRWQPWVWSVVLATIALVLLRWPAAPRWSDGVRWMLALLLTHGWFLAYNRLDKGTRVWLFAGLQAARSTVLLVLVPATVIGALALGVHVLAKWVPYCIYRLGGADWPDAPFHLIRLLFFLILALLLAVATGPSLLASGTAAALLAWNLFRARQELAVVCAAAHRVDRTPRPDPPS